ncbi:diguanylate cyclase/phosphodiesterase (GGDEF & EAL domains) with PAS/PAC sensor(s) [hydrothermal vent metagenome]|uniref:histidine kinase n=1 Tax=hydrothermal vent metagenome TaxID=652676 RepID=A0A3B1D2L7_9ZZZZ
MNTRKKAGEKAGNAYSSVSSGAIPMSGILHSPARLLIIVLGAIFFGESVIMLVIHNFMPPMGHEWVGLIDALALMVVITPPVYILYYKSLKKNINLLEMSEKRNKAITQSTNTAIVQINSEGNITFWNNAAEKIFGYSPDEVLGKTFHPLIAPGRYSEAIVKGLAQFSTTGKGVYIGKIFETFALRKNGSEFPVELSVSAVQINNEWHSIGIVNDITKRRRAEEALVNTNRVLKMLWDCNQALVRFENERSLLNELCRIIVEVGGYRLVWIGFTEHDEAKSIIPVAYYGFEKGYLEALKTTWADTGTRGREPTGIAIRSGVTQVARNILTDPSLKPWRKEALKRGYASSASIPLLVKGRGIGALSVYSADKDAFDEKELYLLNELANDLAFGIETSRTRSELRRSEKQYEDLYENAPDMLASVEAKTGNIVRCNKTLAEGIGYSKEEIIGRHIFTLHHANCMEKVRSKVFPALKKSKEVRDAELMLQRKDGSSLEALLNVTTIRDEHGNISHSRLSWRDITALKQMEKNLIQRDEMLNRSQEIAHIGSWELDLANDKTYWSDELYNIYGLKRGDVYPSYKTFLNLVHPDDREKIKIFRSQPFEKGNTNEIEIRIARPDGVERILLDQFNVEFDKTGEPFRLIGVNLDITQRKEAHEKIRRSNAELRYALEKLEKTQSMLIRSEKLASLGHLAAGVSHEIKNPINIILANVQLIQMEDNLGDGVKESCDIMFNQVERVVKIIDNLRDFARERKPEIKKIDLHSFLDKTIALVEYEMRAEGVDIRINYLPESIIIDGDQDQLAQVFLNIINNAHYSINQKRSAQTKKEPGLLSVKTCVKEENAHIIFSDNGAGIDRETLRRIYDPFFTTKPENQGTGLGLSIALGIIENHGGTINATSEAQGGAIFTIILPLARLNKDKN